VVAFTGALAADGVVSRVDGVVLAGAIPTASPHTPTPPGGRLLVQALSPTERHGDRLGQPVWGSVENILSRRPPTISGMPVDPADCPEHVWSSIGVTVIDGTTCRIWDCERCTAWTKEPLRDDRRVPWGDTDIST
jgi:hypothetical protein